MNKQYYIINNWNRTDKNMTTVRTQQKKQRHTDKIGTKTEDILAGNITVHELSKISESIAVMDISCKHCGALKFKA